MYKKSVMIVIGIFVVFSLVGLASMANSAKERGKANHSGKIAIIHVEGVILGGRGQSTVFIKRKLKVDHIKILCLQNVK